MVVCLVRAKLQRAALQILWLQVCQFFSQLVQMLPYILPVSFGAPDEEEVLRKGLLAFTCERLDLKEEGSQIQGALKLLGTNERISWDLREVKRFGFDQNFLSIETGKKSTCGPGTWTFGTSKASFHFNISTISHR